MEPTQGIGYRIADGENAFQVWREETTLTLRKLARLSGVPTDRIDLFERGYAVPYPDELEGLAKALQVTPELLVPSVTEPADGERT